MNKGPVLLSIIMPKIKNLICLKNLWNLLYRSLSFNLYTSFFNRDTNASKLALSKYLLYNPTQSSQLKRNAVKQKDSAIDSWDRGAGREGGKGYIRSEDKSIIHMSVNTSTLILYYHVPKMQTAHQHMGTFTSNQNKHIHYYQEQTSLHSSARQPSD